MRWGDLRSAHTVPDPRRRRAPPHPTSAAATGDALNRPSPSDTPAAPDRISDTLHGFAEVLAAARLGQAWALTLLFRRFSGPVAGFVRGRSPAEADDIVSEVFTAALTSLDRFAGDESDFRGWLFTIASRRVVDDLRRRSRRVETLPYEPDLDDRQVGSAEEGCLTDLGTDWARAVLGRLAPDQRDVLLLRVVGDLTVEQVAAVLGKTIGAVKQLQRRGLSSARRILDSEGVPL